MNQFPAHLSSLVCGQREAEPQAKAGGHGEISPRRAAVSALDYGCGGAADLTGNNSLLRGPDAPPHPPTTFPHFIRLKKPGFYWLSGCPG